LAEDRKGDLGRKYIRAAAQRLVAVDMLSNAGLDFEAVYLAGYVIECSLKAMILSRVPWRHRADYARLALLGRHGHDFDYLRRRLAERGVEPPGQLVRELRNSEWTTNLRYEVGQLDRTEAASFISMARRFLEWAQRSI
jgi:hypothetical protein